MENSGKRRLFVTRILQQFDSDTFIPNIDMSKYNLLSEWVGESVPYPDIKSYFHSNACKD